MKNTKHIPEADEFWPGAEKLLDRHFRRRRILIWLFAFILPVLVTGLALLYFSHPSPDVKQSSSSGMKNSREKNSVETQANAANTPTLNYEDQTISEKDENKSPEFNDKSTGAKNNRSSQSGQKPIHHPSSSMTVTNILSDKKTPAAALTMTSGSNDWKHPSTGVRNKSNPKKLPAAPLRTTSQDMNSTSEDLHHQALRPTTASTTLPDKHDIPVPEINSTLHHFNPGSAVPPLQNHDLIFALVPLRTNLNIEVTGTTIRENNWPKPLTKSTGSNIVWMAGIYGSAQYVTKTLSAPGETSSYITRRNQEEKPVVAPSLGMSVTAVKHGLSISTGLEYSVYGEKTNYRPYSLQQQITDDGSWQTFLRNYVDTDTAYVRGNQYLLQTHRTVMDSSYHQHMDTTQAYAYDRKMAASNGVNRIRYIEIPVEVSCALTNGRAGVGISAGVSAAWIVSEKGYYLRRDDTGIESLEEIKSFRKFMMNGRAGIDIYYHLNAQLRLLLRPQYRTNLNSVFSRESGINQKYSSTGILFGIFYILN